MHQTAADFLSTLMPWQRRKAMFPFDCEERLNWHYIPKVRGGVCLLEMTPSQQEAALRLLQTGLSPQGFTKIATIRVLESVLDIIEQGTGPIRHPDLYYFAVFGEPSEQGVWGWRCEGHHISLNWTLKDGQVLSSSPQFLGANPAETRIGPDLANVCGNLVPVYTSANLSEAYFGLNQVIRTLAAEEDLARALLESLMEAQRQEAVIHPETPPEILTRAERVATPLEDAGIAYGQLSVEQQALLLALIRQHTDLLAPALAQQRLDTIHHTGLESLKFAWMGELQRGLAHYYRIQGQTFLIEYVNYQNDANHIHTVWRDFTGDFATDRLENV